MWLFRYNRALIADAPLHHRGASVQQSALGKIDWLMLARLASRYGPFGSWGDFNPRAPKKRDCHRQTHRSCLGAFSEGNEP